MGLYFIKQLHTLVLSMYSHLFVKTLVQLIATRMIKNFFRRTYLDYDVVVLHYVVGTNLLPFLFMIVLCLCDIMIYYYYVLLSSSLFCHFCLPCQSPRKKGGATKIWGLLMMTKLCSQFKIPQVYSLESPTLFVEWGKNIIK